MQELYFYLGVGLMLVAIVVFYQLANLRFVKKLSHDLYVLVDPDSYLAAIDSFKGKIFLRKSRRELLKVDAYAMKKDHAALINQFKILANCKLSYGKLISLYEKEVQFYATNNYPDEALASYEKLINEANKIQSDQLDKVVEEATINIEVYVKRNGKYATRLVDLAKNTEHQLIKGVYLYKAAKCYYYLADEDNTVKYLKKAYNNLTSDVWRKHIESCLEDFKNLDKR